MSKPNKITGIVVENDDDVTFYFDGSDDPWGIDEFVPDSKTRVGLEKIEAMIIDFNLNEVPPPPPEPRVSKPPGKLY